MSLLLKRKALACTECCDENPYGCFMFSLTPFDHIGPAQDPNQTAPDGFVDVDGYSYKINGDFDWPNPTTHPKGWRSSKRCTRILIWQGVTVGKDPANTYCTLTPASSTPTYKLGTIRHPRSIPYFAAGENVASGPYLNTKPNYWQCLQIVGIDGASQWSPPSFTLIEQLLRAATANSKHSPAPWYQTAYGAGSPSTPQLLNGALVDVAAILSNYTRGTSKTPRTYQAETAGVTWINQIRIAPSDQP